MAEISPYDPFAVMEGAAFLLTYDGDEDGTSPTRCRWHIDGDNASQEDFQDTLGVCFCGTQANTVICMWDGRPRTDTKPEIAPRLLRLPIEAVQPVLSRWRQLQAAVVTAVSAKINQRSGSLWRSTLRGFTAEVGTLFSRVVELFLTETNADHYHSKIHIGKDSSSLISECCPTRTTNSRPR
jgi:hypothetical protein